MKLQSGIQGGAMADGTAILNEISGGLDALANQAVGMIGEDRTFNEMWGWNMPSMNRNEFADYIRRPKDLIQSIDSTSISDADLARLSLIPSRIVYIQNNVIGNLPGGNAFHVYIVINSVVDSIETILQKYSFKLPPFSELEDKKLLPTPQIRELRRIATSIDRLRDAEGDLSATVADIHAAHALAETLHADMRNVKQARIELQTAHKNVADADQSIQASRQTADAALAQLEAIRQAAEAVLARANTAYSAATTEGLGAAFSDRAARLSRTIWILGLVLVAALAGGAFITYQRVEFAHRLMMLPNVSYSVLWLNVTFTALSVSAPVWLAWLLTRQIGQRFRLAEDYGYKATVAKAYEGYRAEAAAIDSELAKRLFAIALEILGEPPLRQVEKDSPGSPANELGGPLAGLIGGKSSDPSGPT